MVQTSPTGDFRDPNARTRFADVPASAWATVDIGSPRGTFAWTGRLLQPRGMPIALLDAAEIRLEATGREERAAIAADGSFGMRLAPATYATRLFVFAAGCELSLDPLEISEHDVERDLRVPAAVLRVHVRFRDDIDESRRALPDLTLKEQPPRGVNSFPPLTTRRRACGADGTLYFFGVRPGEYVLLSSRPIAGSSDGSLSVQVGASDDELDLEILVEKS
jgi:hypothetical protein